jgi:hypothetical protein
MKRFIAATFALLATFGHAQAQDCAVVDTVITALANRFGEELAAVLATGQHTVQIYANPETGTWTAITVAPTGVACVRASGTGYKFIDPKPNA